jgi:hypothetical protein
MALSEHVRKLANEAVAGKETTDWIRERGSESVTESLARRQESGDTERARRQALDAVSQSETMRQIRLVSVNTIDAPLLTPKGESLRVSGNERIAYLWRGHVSTATKDERERDDGR